MTWKILDFQGCHENGLDESFKMSPHLMGLGWHPRSLLWPASGSGLDMIWKLKCQLRHIKWGLILKLSLRPFLSHPWNPLRGFFAFRVPLPDCGLGWLISAKSGFFFVRFAGNSFHLKRPKLISPEAKLISPGAKLISPRTKIVFRTKKSSLFC